jgi:hypothetical protein
LICHSCTIRSELGKGSGWSRTPCTTLKIAVAAPIPTASVRTATDEKLGARSSDLREYLNSAIIGNRARREIETRTAERCGVSVGREGGT